MIERNVPWLPWIYAITLWPFILYRKGYRTSCLEAHERHHWNEQRAWWVLPWFIAYLLIGIFYIGRSADRHPMETEAYRLQRQCEKETRS